jgi:beta-glucosidase
MDPIFKKAYPQGPELAQPDNIEAGDFDIIAQPLDFLGINYYTRIWASTSTPPVPAPNQDGVSDMGWENYAQGLSDLLQGIHRDYTLPPIYITENGYAEADKVVDGRVSDPGRQAYMQTHLQALHEAMTAGVDVRGFFYWSLMDNFEWACGYDKRFGLVHVDYATQQRTLKDSALRYREFIASQRR